MKQIIKHLATLTASVTAILSSCQNDDIPVGQSITFKVNPSTVVENLYEWNAGDLTSLTSDAVLNVDLYAYNKAGKLVAKDRQSFNSYTHIMTSNFSLTDGEYTMVAISHVNTSVEYWSFEGIEDINTLKIVDNGYIGGKSKILGLTVQKVSIGEEESIINIDIQNAGAVACVTITNWNRYNDVESFGLISKQSCDYISMNSYGNVEYSIASRSNYSFYLVKFYYTSNQTGATTYFFTFPIKNAALKFFAETTNGSRTYLGTNLVDDIKLGNSYLFGYDVTSEETEWIDMTPSHSAQGYIKKSAQNQIHAVYDYDNKSISFR